MFKPVPSVTELTPQTLLNGVTYMKGQLSGCWWVHIAYFLLINLKSFKTKKKSGSWTQVILVPHNVKKAYLGSRETDNVMNYVQKVSMSVFALFNLQVISWETLNCPSSALKTLHQVLHFLSKCSVAELWRMPKTEESMQEAGKQILLDRQQKYFGMGWVPEACGKEIKMGLWPKQNAGVYLSTQE